MTQLTAKQLREFLNEIEADGNDLSLIEINFRRDEDSDVTPIEFVFEDLHDESNTALVSIVLQARQLHQAETHLMCTSEDAQVHVDELNNLIGREAFTSALTRYRPSEIRTRVISGSNLTSEEVDRLDLRTDFIIY
jgi:hypothetical protein